MGLIKLASDNALWRAEAVQRWHQTAANNSEFAEKMGVKVDYVKAFGAGGIGGAYLRMTSGNANEALKNHWPEI